MKYLTSERFLKLNLHAQREIMNWWEPTVGDIYCSLYNNQENNIMVINECNLKFLSFITMILKSLVYRY